MKNIDVIIPVYRPTEKFKMLIKALMAQSVKVQKIILMHTEDGEDLSWVKKMVTVPVQEIMVKKEAFDHGRTRDEAMRLATSDVVLYLTQDAVPSNAYLLENLWKALNSAPEIAAAYARQKAEKESGLIECYTRKFNYPKESRVKSEEDMEMLGIKTYFCSNVCAAYKRNIYFAMGGFEKPIIFNEDMIFAAKAIRSGYKIAYAADAVVWHAHNYSCVQQLKRNFDVGVSQASYPEIFKNVKSEKEGIRLVKETAFYLIKKKKPWLLISLAAKSFCKYLGFWLGKHYAKLPNALIDKLSMNPEFFSAEEKQECQIKRKD